MITEIRSCYFKARRRLEKRLWWMKSMGWGWCIDLVDYKGLPQGTGLFSKGSDYDFNVRIKVYQNPFDTGVTVEVPLWVSCWEKDEELLKDYLDRVLRQKGLLPYPALKHAKCPAAIDIDVSVLEVTNPDGTKETCVGHGFKNRRCGVIHNYTTDYDPAVPNNCHTAVGVIHYNPELPKRDDSLYLFAFPAGTEFEMFPFNAAPEYIKVSGSRHYDGFYKVCNPCHYPDGSLIPATVVNDFLVPIKRMTATEATFVQLSMADSMRNRYEAMRNEIFRNMIDQVYSFHYWQWAIGHDPFNCIPDVKPEYTYPTWCMRG